MGEDFGETHDHHIFAVHLALEIPEAQPEHRVPMQVEEFLLCLSVGLLASSYKVNLLQSLSF